MPKDYSSYNLNDFLEDDFFIKWIVDNDEETNKYWSEVIEYYPEKIEIIKQAKFIIQSITREFEYPSREIIRKNKEVVNQRIKGNKESYQFYNERRITTYEGWDKKVRKYIYFAAACIGFFILVYGYWQYQINSNTVKFASDFGEVRSILLPDQSEVVLNANSEIYYNQKDWINHKVREVWLAGEAYFSVKHLDQDTPFYVHTENLNVEVIGTEFSVKDKKDETRVILSTGEIRLTNKSALNKDTVTVKPGELVKFNKRYDFTVTAIDADRATSWRNKELELDKTSLHDIATEIEEFYGVEVIFIKKELSQKTASGKISLLNIDAINELLSEAFQIRVYRNNDIVFIDDK